ncbi:MAG: ATP-binding protein [Clostridium sp.]
MQISISKLSITQKSRIFLWCSFPMIISVLFLSQRYGNEYVVNKLMDLLCGSIGASIGVIAFIRKENSGIYYRSIGIGFIFLSCLEFLFIIIEYVYLNYISYDVIEGILTNAQFYLEYLIIILPYLLSKRNSSLIHSIFSYFLCVITILGVSGLVYNNNIMNKMVYFYQNNMFYFLILLSISISLTRESRNFVLKVNRWHIYVYLMFIFFSQLTMMINGYNTESLKFYSDILKYCGYFILYEGTIEHLLSQAYEDMKLDLERIKHTQELVNKELSLKNNILSEHLASLNKSEKNYNEMLSKFNDGIILLYLNKVVYTNRATEDLLKLGEKQCLLGKDLDKVIDMILMRIVRDEKEYRKDIINSRIFSLKEGKALIYKGIKVDNAEYEIYIVKADNLNHIIFIKNVTDISNEIEQRKKYEELMKEKDLKEDFYTNISHELRTPVNVIYSALQLKEIYVRDKNYEMVEKNNSTIKQNCLRLIRTVNNFIDTNKIDEGYMKPDYKTYNIVEVVENIAQASIKYINKIEGTLIFDAEEEEIYTKFDKVMIERVILNLLSNSIKYGNVGGKIYINIYTKGDEVKISLKNDGSLIPLEAHPYIFQKFTKSDSSLSRAKEGSGLGLYLVNELIKLNNGTLELRTSKDGENEFIITIPIKYSSTDIIYSEVMEMNALEEKVDIEFSDIYI